MLGIFDCMVYFYNNFIGVIIKIKIKDEYLKKLWQNEKSICAYAYIWAHINHRHWNNPTIANSPSLSAIELTLQEIDKSDQSQVPTKNNNARTVRIIIGKYCMPCNTGHMISDLHFNYDAY